MTHKKIEAPVRIVPIIERPLEERRRYNRDQKRVERARRRAAEEKANPIIDASVFYEAG